MPRFDVIDFDAWTALCRHEFEHSLLKHLRYTGLTVRAMTSGWAMFKTRRNH